MPAIAPQEAGMAVLEHPVLLTRLQRRRKASDRHPPEIHHRPLKATRPAGIRVTERAASHNQQVTVARSNRVESPMWITRPDLELSQANTERQPAGRQMSGIKLEKANPSPPEAQVRAAAPIHIRHSAGVQIMGTYINYPTLRPATQQQQVPAITAIAGRSEIPAATITIFPAAEKLALLEKRGLWGMEHRRHLPAAKATCCRPTRRPVTAGAWAGRKKRKQPKRIRL